MSYSYNYLVPHRTGHNHTNIGAKASLGDNISVWPDDFESDGIGNDGGAAVGDISEWTCVYEDGGAFQCLHQRRLNRVLEKHSQRSCHPLYKRHYENIINAGATKTSWNCYLHLNMSWRFNVLTLPERVTDTYADFFVACGRVVDISAKSF